jgi:hypothetical protein
MWICDVVASLDITALMRRCSWPIEEGSVSEPATGSPDEEGHVSWVDAVGQVTVPLLAGFSVTSVIVVSDDAANFRWSGGTILALAVASILFIAAVQCAGHTRLYFSSQPNRGRKWALWTRVFYHWGIVALLTGLGLALAPLHGSGTENNLRWSASAAAFAACFGEAAYIFVRWGRSLGEQSDSDMRGLQQPVRSVQLQGPDEPST